MSSFEFFPELYLWFRPGQNHYSYKQTIKCTCTHTVHFRIRTKAQSVRRQHKKRTSEKSEMVTYEDITQVARNMSVWSIWSKPLGRMGDDMLKWLVIDILKKLALYLYEGELCFKVMERINDRAPNENFELWFDCHK